MKTNKMIAFTLGLLLCCSAFAVEVAFVSEAAEVRTSNIRYQPDQFSEGDRLIFEVFEDQDRTVYACLRALRHSSWVLHYAVFSSRVNNLTFRQNIFAVKVDDRKGRGMEPKTKLEAEFFPPLESFDFAVLDGTRSSEDRFSNAFRDVCTQVAEEASERWQEFQEI